MTSKLPQKYRWLADEPGPRILKIALRYYGLKEIPGKPSHPTIMSFAARLGGWIKTFYKSDEIPWCGLFMGYCAAEAGFPHNQKALSAVSWKDWGTYVPMYRAQLGDILVFKRKGGYHVGLYVGEDAICYHVLGANQSDSVNIMRLEKIRLEAVRRCPWKIKQPDNIRPIRLSAEGAISINEG